MEEVVNAHAAETTTSEQSHLGVITCSKLKLITHEISDREQTDCACVFMDNCSKPARNIGRRRLKGKTAFFFRNLFSRRDASIDGE